MIKTHGANTAAEQNKNVLTIPGIKHISDEVVYEGDLRFGHTAGVPVKHWHHHRQPLSLLLICLQGKHQYTERS